MIEIQKIMKSSSIILLFITMIIGQAAFAQNAKVKGRIVDAITNEPLPYVNVLVKGTASGSVTDPDGNFTITGLKPGFIAVQVSFIGYEPTLSDQVLVTNAKTPYIEIKLKQATTALTEVKVTAKPFERTEEAPVALQRIGLQEIEGNPGSNRDISRVIQSFPGVGGTPSFRNDIIIRGGGPSEQSFYLDGVEIPTLNHFSTQGASGGPVGIINADFIRSVNFYSGAFPANRGDAMSGVFEFSQADGNDERLKFRGSLGASEMSATFDGPIGEKTNFILSARRSYLQFLFQALELPFLPTFTDYQFKVRTRLDKKNELTITSIGALDNFKINDNITDPDEGQQVILDNIRVNNQWSYAIGAVYKHFAEKSYHTFVLSRNMLSNEIYKHPENNEALPRNFDYTSQEIENKFRYEGTTRLGTWKMTYGSGFQYAKYTNDTYAKLYRDDQTIDFNYDTYLDLVKYSAFAQLSKKMLDQRLTLSAGFRLDGNTYSSKMQNPFLHSSPRFSASYSITPKTSINGNVGMYYQMPGYTTLGYRNAQDVLVNKENNLEYIRSDHYILGLEHQLQPSVVFTVEGFYKNYDKYPFSVQDNVPLANKGAGFGVVGDEEVLSIGKGRAYGLEVLNRTRLNNGLNMIAAYTFVRSEFQNTEGEYIPSAWDNRHIFTLTSTKTFGSNWTAGLKWRYVSGQPYTPWDMEKSANREAWDANNGAFLAWDRLNSERLAAFHQLDVRVDKKFFFSRWSLMIYLDIQNLYNFKAENQENIVREQDANGEFILTDNGSKYKLKSIENTSGTVLPTVGIMIEL